ncbi:RHOMBOID-like protein 12, mitochondrial isoform X1 [Tasmannia lanceolata]|uniref:RHOMBOID-like protein 12, mitochondrial isoform X1 n=1 Tax=Tasmannia lanceolata TaxID=3420 RepID=UPI004062E140
MQRLLSLRLLSRNYEQTSIPSFVKSHLSKNFISQTAEKTPKELLKTSLSHSPTSTTSLCLDYFRSWRSQNLSSQKISGFFLTPLVVKQMISNTHLLIRRESFLDSGVRLFRTRISQFKQLLPLGGNYGRSFMPNAVDVVLILIAVNVAVFILWRTADPIFMMNNFAVSIENIASGRFHTLVTSAFSHVKLSHLFSNMFGLYFFGSNIGHQFGPKFLVKLYLAGAIAGSICFLAHMAFLIASSKDTRTFYLSPKIITGLGASGALNSIILLHIFLFPKATHYVNLIIPVPAMLLGALLIGTDIWRMLEGDSHIAGSAHLGGTLVAVLVWARIKKRWI